jgi:hypothetical protein
MNDIDGVVGGHSDMADSQGHNLAFDVPDELIGLRGEKHRKKKDKKEKKRKERQLSESDGLGSDVAFGLPD